MRRNSCVHLRLGRRFAARDALEAGGRLLGRPGGAEGAYQFWRRRTRQADPRSRIRCSCACCRRGSIRGARRPSPRRPSRRAVPPSSPRPLRRGLRGRTRPWRAAATHPGRGSPLPWRRGRRSPSQSHPTGPSSLDSPASRT
eukprot:scaffold986_cov237-Pinguiococcus_pyrenoidosus.AAC.20